MDDFHMGMANNGSAPRGALRGTSTGVPNQATVTYDLSYSGLGVNSPLWIDPDGHEFPIGVLFTNGGYEMDILMTAMVPEPTTLCLLAVGGLAMLHRCRAA